MNASLSKLRAATVALCLLCASSGLLADVVYLKDGTKKEGKVIERNDKEVILEIHVQGLRAAIRIPMSKVQRIAKLKTPLEEYGEMLASLSPNDAQGFYKLALWCEEKNLVDEAEECLRKAIEISPTLEKAGIRLGLVRVGRAWHTVDRIREMSATHFQARKYDEAAKVLEYLKPLPPERLDSITRRKVLMDLAKCYEGQGKWQEAISLYDEAVRNATKKSDIALARARQRILAENPDGTFSCPSDPTLFKTPKVQQAKKLYGKQPLTRPEVMDFAVRVQANQVLKEVKDGMANAAEKSRFNPEEANLLYAQMDALSEQADYLVPNVSRPVRFQIALARSKILDVLAAKCLKEIQGDPGYNKAQEYPGRLEQAQAYLAKIDELYTIYQEKMDILRPFSEQSAKPIDQALAAIEKANDLKRKATEATNQLMDHREIERLEEIIATSYAKAKAINPSNRNFKYGYDSFRSADGLYHFVDDGKEWRRRSDSCIRYCEKALEASKKKLELCRKYPTRYRSDISRCKLEMIRIYEMMMQTIASRDRKGDDRRH